jgi:prevent-host-death family protein
MQRIIGVPELQRGFRRVFEQVVSEGVPYILTRGSRPEAVLLAYQDYLRYQEWHERVTLGRFDRLVERLSAQNAAVDESEIEADVAAARTEGAG